MGIPSFFKLPKHKEFNYSPLYYDERKEELEKKKKEASNISFSEKPITIKGFFKDRAKSNRKSAVNKSNIRLIILILIMFLVLYYIFYK